MKTTYFLFSVNTINNQTETELINLDLLLDDKLDSYQDVKALLEQSEVEPDKTLVNKLLEYSRVK